MPDAARAAFATPQHISIGETFFQIEGGDLDLDGDVDLVVGSSSEHLLRILRTMEPAAWTVAQSLPVTDRFWHVQVVDLDGRTGKDILVTSDGAFVTLSTTEAEPFLSVTRCVSPGSARRAW
jgi:hypothetical protein